MLRFACIESLKKSYLMVQHRFGGTTRPKQKCLLKNDGCDGLGRHRGNEDKKDVLNILSFECKAAFHQCYSALWVEMIPRLMVNERNQEFSQTFHTLWHLDHRLAIPGHARDVHLLHGLALGLHPAFGMLLTTETGSRLVGETVAEPENIAAQERFLHAGLVSLYLFAAARRSRCRGIS